MRPNKANGGRRKPGYKLVVCPSIIHYRTKKRIYRRDGRPFRIWVRDRVPVTEGASPPVVRHGPRRPRPTPSATTT
jgi:hypothetical protein